MGPRRHAAAAHPVAGDHHGLPREEHVGGAQDPVHGGLAGAVAIVEEMLGVGVIDRDHGKRQHAFLLHGAEPDHPVVVSSVPPMTFLSRLLPALFSPWSWEMRSAPSSMVTWGPVLSTASRWL